jgi:hypothetical protein
MLRNSRTTGRTDYQDLFTEAPRRGFLGRSLTLGSCYDDLDLGRPLVLEPEHVAVAVLLRAATLLVEVVPTHLHTDQPLAKSLRGDEGGPGFITDPPPARSLRPILRPRYGGHTPLSTNGVEDAFYEVQESFSRCISTGGFLVTNPRFSYNAGVEVPRPTRGLGPISGVDLRLDAHLPVYRAAVSGTRAH